MSLKGWSLLCFVLYFISLQVIGQTNSKLASLINNKNIFSSENKPEVNSSGDSSRPIDQYMENKRNGVLLPGEVNINQLLPTVEKNAPAPFGANLFAGGYETERVDGLSEDYLIASGDKVSVSIWGAVTLNQVLTVDNQGNIFIPNIGPIQLLGVTASNVNKVVTQKIKSIYQNNVNIYVNLLSATPVSVFIAGSVYRPGQYAGMASDTVLYFLKRAGGIDSERGSYRDIRILRNGKVIAKIDIYEFLQAGKLPTLTFKDRDTIFVSEQGTVVDVFGKVKKPFRFEFTTPYIKGLKLLKLATPLSDTSHVLIQGNREYGPFSVYLTLKQLETFKIYNGDKLLFNQDQRPQVYDIELQGSYLGPSFYTVSDEARLHDVLARIPVNPKLSDYEAVYILRKSVAEEQREILDQSLNRLERTVFFSPSSSTGEASIKAQEAQLISDFIERARKIRPLGKVIVSNNGEIANISLEQGDTVVIPQKSDLIQIGGEVMVPQAVVFSPAATIDDYVSWAGGYSNRADEDRFVIIRRNGLTEILEVNSQVELMAGDKIIIMPMVETKLMQAVKDITQILFQLAVTANAID